MRAPARRKSNIASRKDFFVCQGHTLMGDLAVTAKFVCRIPFMWFVAIQQLKLF
jgi:hypothetical protein